MISSSYSRLKEVLFQVQSLSTTRPLVVPAPSLPNQVVETDLDLSQPSGLPTGARNEQFACTYQVGKVEESFKAMLCLKVLSEAGGHLVLASIGARIQHKWACSAVAPDVGELERGATLAQSVRDAGLRYYCLMITGYLHFVHFPDN